MNLNPPQQTAAAHTLGPMMVLAGPGSGKTAVIVARAVHMVRSEHIVPERILVIAYSRAAAQEMKRRFALRFAQDGGAVPPVTFGTFHSVFFRILRNSGGAGGMDSIMEDGERRIFVRAQLAELEYDADEEFLSALLNEMSLVRNELHDMAHYHAVTIGDRDFKRVCANYQAYKEEKGKIDFDDMLCRAYQLLLENKTVLNSWRKRFTYIMIDEFQDINRVQYEAVRLLAAPVNNIFIVGDDDQSIYRFRGSRPEFLLHFPADFPGARQVTLDVNHRSTDAIIQFANAVIAENQQRYPKNIVGTGQKGLVPVLLKPEDQNQEALRIGERIRQMQSKGASLDEIAIVFRLNIQARAFADAFMHLNIPYRARDEMPIIYEHWLAEDIFAYLRLAINARQKGYNPDATRIANKPYRFISKAFLEGLKKNDRNMFAAYPRDKALHIAQKSRLEELHLQLNVLAGKKTVDAIRYIRRQIGYNTHIIDHCEYRKLDPAGLVELADEIQEAAKLHPAPEDFLAHARNSVAAKSAGTPAGPCVTLSTLHSAKGLEFERVFIAGVVEDLLPHARSRTAAEIEEERRLLYVGITRAKGELFLSVPKFRYDKPVAPSRFIQNIQK
ncbi:MAG: ATP-dependent helicase [Defluviitaleaceae bacterium]|nr:ATP-dependent helicase [Defluviitaleaceae bacterium]MCL2238560.1 ATP-dependent helicase [Defluviitaleaceae bacterium]